MPQRTTPLLAGDDNDPALSGPPNHAVEEESALSRLIAESTPPTALMPFSAAMDETTQSTTPALSLLQHKKASFITILAGTLLTLQWGFVWGAYFSNSWMDSHLQIFIGWQEKFLPWLDKHTDVVLQQMSVFTLSDNLRDDKEYGSLVGIWICSVILPCIFLIVGPIWILTDCTSPPKRRTMALGQPLSRAWLELTIRLSWLVLFIHLFLNVAITGIELQWEDTDLQVHNRLKGPFVSYLLGCTCALITVVVLRMPYLEHVRLLSYPEQPKLHQPAPRQMAVTPDPTPPQATHAPPANAFQLPWLRSTDENDDEVDARQPLLEQRSPPPSQSSSTTKRKSWQTVVIFQLGLLSLLLWGPALALAQFRVLYAGIIMDLVKNPAFNVYVWELPSIIWNTGVRAETPLWILILTATLMGLFVVLLPLLAQGVAMMTWINHGPGKWRDVLTLLHPTLCGIPFAAALIVTVPSFIDIGEDIDDDICVRIEHVVRNQCLISGGVLQWGAWFLLAQAVCLEAFVVLTLWWTAPPRPPTNTV